MILCLTSCSRTGKAGRNDTRIVSSARDYFFFFNVRRLSLHRTNCSPQAVEAVSYSSRWDEGAGGWAEAAGRCRHVAGFGSRGAGRGCFGLVRGVSCTGRHRLCLYEVVCQRATRVSAGIPQRPLRVTTGACGGRSRCRTAGCVPFLTAFRTSRVAEAGGQHLCPPRKPSGKGAGPRGESRSRRHRLGPRAAVSRAGVRGGQAGLPPAGASLALAVA